MTVRRSTIYLFLAALCAFAQGPMQMPPAGSGSQAAQLPLSGRTGLSGAVVATQSAIPGVTTSINTLNTSVQVQGVYAGSVRGPGVPADRKLTLREAIRRGLEANLGGIGANLTVQQFRGQARVARSGLLPNLSASLRENVQQTNLAAFGFRIPNGPTVVGPFNYFDLRATLTQTVLDFTSLNNYRAAKTTTEAAEMAARDSRDLVVYAVAGAYLQVLAAQGRIEAVRAQIETARTSLTSMQDQRNAGVVAQIDVNRSQVELQTQQQRLVSIQNDLAKQKINLARLIGLPPAEDFEAADQVGFAAGPELNFAEALKQASENRSDLKAATAQLRAAELARAAARSERLPSLSVSADYGAIGKNPSDAHGTFTVMGSLRVPIWQGGRTEGAIAQAEATVQQRRAELEDLRLRIEAEVRSSFLDMDSAASQVAVARNNEELARETLRLTRERFNAGITSTVEVVQAQQAVSVADLDYITSVFAHNVAKISLARAIGRAEENIPLVLQLK